MAAGPDSFNYLTTEDILSVHELVVESNEDTEAGVASTGDIEYTVEHMRANTLHRSNRNTKRLSSSGCHESWTLNESRTASNLTGPRATVTANRTIITRTRVVRSKNGR